MFHLASRELKNRSDQFERATGERVAAPDGVALQAAHETVFGVAVRAERVPDHARHAPEATERGHAAGREASSENGRGAGTALRPAATASDNCRNRVPGATGAAGNLAAAAAGTAVRMDRGAEPRRRSRWSQHQRRQNSTSGCRHAVLSLGRAQPSVATNSPGAGS